MPVVIPERDPCPFCENLEGAVDADSDDIKRCAFIERQELAAAFVNPYQGREGATLVVPTRHASTLLDLTEPEAEALARLVRRVAQGIHDAFDPVGLNIYQNNGVASGQTIPPLPRPRHAQVSRRAAGRVVRKARRSGTIR